MALHWFRDRAQSEAVAAEITTMGRRTILLGADLDNPSVARRTVTEVRTALGSLAIVVCNAGMIQRKPLLDITDQDWDRVHAVNLHGAVAVAQEAAKHVVTAGTGGRIVVILAINPAHVNPDIAHYVASKGGIMMLGRTMALELAPHGIMVNLVAPGTIETDITPHMLADPAFRTRKLAGVPLGRAGLDHMSVLGAGDLPC